MNTYCDVALRLPVRQWFTYRLPEWIQPFARPGVRVTVPLRNEVAVGIVGKLHDRAPDATVRDVLDVVDSEPWLSPELLALGNWVADYYFCSPGEALFAMVPSGLAASVETVYAHNPQTVPTRGLKPAERKLCIYLSEHPEATREEMLHAFPQASTGKRLEGLVARKLVECRRRIKPQRVSGPSVPGVQWIGATKPAQESDDPLVTYLRSQDEPVRTEVLAREFPDAPRRLMRLARKKWVRAVKLPGHYTPDLPQAVADPVEKLTAAQQKSATAIIAALDQSPATFLLHGVTGSGKTEVYIRSIRHALEHGGSAIYLVPEIGLATHLLERLTPHFRERVVILHSGLTKRARALAWKAVHDGERTLVVGTRSAVWAPVKNLKLVVIDEEQDASFKQDDPAPRYNGRDVAIWRAQKNGAVCVMGSATPSLESWANAQAGKYQLLELPERIGGRALPDITLVDRRNDYPRIAQGIVSPTLEREVRRVLADSGQVILFLNRRGFSGSLRCGDCGHTVPCPDCSVAYSYHRDRRQLRCHFCGRSDPAPTVCERCGSSEFLYPRAGTQKVEGELSQLFEGARIARLDLDVASQRGGAEKVLSAFGRREYDILLGTQMVTKGLHFPHVALVGILNADLSLDLPDFRAGERTFQQVLQVAGRAGRGETPGQVLLQTYQPEHGVYTLVRRNDYAGFAAAELEQRRFLGYPPGHRIVLILARGEEESKTEAAIEQLAERFKSVKRAPYVMTGPAAAPLKRLRRYYRYHLLLRTTRVKATLGVVAQILDRPSPKGVRFNVDVDPVHLL